MCMRQLGRAPEVSVVIPAYGHRDYILRALESVWAQTFTDYELIVVNDGSPDDTADVLRPYVQSGRIHQYIEQPNAGQGAARNRGIAAARGEFVALLDDDDLWPPDKLEWQIATLREDSRAAVVYGQPVPIGDDGNPVEPVDPYGNPLPWPWTAPDGFIHREMADRCWLVSPGQALVRRSALGRRPFDPRIRGCDDWDLWLRLAERWKFCYVDRPALLYRFHGANASRDTLGMRRNEFKLLGKHLLRNVIQLARLRYLLYRVRVYWHWTPSWLLEQVEGDLRAGQVERALGKLHFALRLRPRLLLEPEFRGLYRQVRSGRHQTP